MKPPFSITRRLLCFLVVISFLIVPATTVLALEGDIKPIPGAFEAAMKEVQEKKDNEKSSLATEILQFDQIIQNHRKVLADPSATNEAKKESLQRIAQYEAEKEKLQVKLDSLAGEDGKIIRWIKQSIIYVGNALISILGTAVNVTVNQFVNLVIKISIVDFHKFIAPQATTENPNPGPGVVTHLWGVVRDFLNITLLFTVLYIAIRTILGIGGADVQRTLVKIIVVGLLINFSILIPKVIIDGSNLLTLYFYEKSGKIENQSDPDSKERDIVSPLVAAMKVPQNLNSLSADRPPSFTTILATISGGIIILLVAAFALLTIGLLLVVRAAILILLIILSPLALFGIIVPQLKKYTDRWWAELTKQTIFAPVFFFLYFFTIEVATSANKAVAASGGNTSTEVIFGVSFTTISLFAAMTVALSAGGTGHKYAVGLATKAKNLTRDYTTGRAASGFANSRYGKYLAAQNPLIGGAIREQAAKYGSGYDKRIKERAERQKQLLTDLKGVELKNANPFSKKKTFTGTDLQQANLAKTRGFLPSLLSGGAKATDTAFNSLGDKERSALIKSMMGEDGKLSSQAQTLLSKLSGDAQKDFQKSFVQGLKPEEAAKYFSKLENFKGDKDEDKEKTRAGIFKEMADYQKTTIAEHAPDTYTAIKNNININEDERAKIVEAEIKRAKAFNTDNEKELATLVKFLQTTKSGTDPVNADAYRELSAKARIKAEEKIHSGDLVIKNSLRKLLSLDERKKTVKAELQSTSAEDANTAINTLEKLLEKGAPVNPAAIGSELKKLSGQNAEYLAVLEPEYLKKISDNADQLAPLLSAELLKTILSNDLLDSVERGKIRSVIIREATVPGRTPPPELMAAYDWLKNKNPGKNF